MSESYHNTVPESGETLQVYKDKAATQDKRVLDFFKSNSRAMLSPSEILYLVFEGEGVPLTSVRRAISNLDKKGLIFRTKLTIEGQYGRQEGTWMYKQKPEQ